MYFRFKIFNKIYIYISDVRLRRRQKRDTISDDKENRKEWFNNVKLPIMNRAQCCCEICGLNVRRKGEIHHILPQAIFPNLYYDTNNMLYLCRKCHNEIHNNPYLNIQLMEQKAKDYNINPKKYFKNL